MKKPPKPRRKLDPAKVGAPPGLLHARADAEPTTVHTIRFDAERLEESDAVPKKGKHPEMVTWVDVTGTRDVERIRAIGERYGLHPLALEDALNPSQRPKVEEYPQTLFLVLRVARTRDAELDIEQIVFFIGEGFVITIQERQGDAFEPVRDRLRTSRERIRTQGATFLAYALIDAGVDAMFPLLESYEERLAALEEEVFLDTNEAHARDIHEFGRELRNVRRVVLPLSEALTRLTRDEHPLVSEEEHLYFRDCQDHLSRMIDILESHRDSLTALSGAHLANLGQQANEVQKVLTIIATVFIPLSFIVGLYGMNFDTSSPWNMPELAWPYGYPFALGLMFALTAGLVVWFRRKGWM